MWDTSELVPGKESLGVLRGLADYKQYKYLLQSKMDLKVGMYWMYTSWVVLAFHLSRSCWGYLYLNAPYLSDIHTAWSVMAGGLPLYDDIKMLSIMQTATGCLFI